MATYTKLPLSASVNGKNILVDATTSGSATSIHTSVDGTSSWDEIYIYAHNGETGSVTCNILWGGTTEPQDLTKINLPIGGSGRVLITDGKLLQNSLIVKAYASIANVVIIDGFVNRIT